MPYTHVEDVVGLDIALHARKNELHDLELIHEMPEIVGG